MKLCVTGTPGTGKTEISKELSKRLEWKLIPINHIAEDLNAYLGDDEKRGAKILDMDKINDYLDDVGGDIIIEGHIAHEVPCDIVVVLRCDPGVLEERLKERYPDKPDKVKENVDAEILGVITSDAVQINEKVYEIETSKKSIDENVKEIMNIIDGDSQEYRIGSIDWLEEYEEKLI
ncbi:MAG: AAA family ATPase [Candidatus Aenigmarchaeota archaeon]|nr:AAA family ATPase [Candidatus Aenigmarchaeota archaeon]